MRSPPPPKYSQLPLVVFTPADAPQTKLAAIRRHGAELRAEARDYDHAEILAKQFAQDTGAAFISPYNDPDVIAGAATIAVEVFEDAAAHGHPHRADWRRRLDQRRRRGGEGSRA